MNNTKAEEFKNFLRRTGLKVTGKKKNLFHEFLCQWTDNEFVLATAEKKKHLEKELENNKNKTKLMILLYEFVMLLKSLLSPWQTQADGWMSEI